jgi:uncharacterized protein (DUF58 family)
VPVGASVDVRLKLAGGPLLGALRLVDAAPDAAGAQADAPPRFTVHRLSSRGTATLTYPLRPVLRGLHKVGPLTGTATDPLGLAEFDQELAGPQRLVVLPRVVPLRGVPPALGAGEGVAGAALNHQGQGATDVLIRPYRQGDELRRVHWRSSARHNELMVRLEERPWRGGMTLLLDRRDAAHRGRGADSSLEFAVGLAASVCLHLLARGEPVTLVTEDGVELTPPGSASGREQLLDALAGLRPSARTDLAGPELTAGSEVLAVLGALAPGQVEALCARHPAGGHAVLCDTASWDPAGGTGNAAESASALRRAGWHVAVATAAMTPDQAWDHLVAAQAVAPAGTR